MIIQYTQETKLRQISRRWLLKTAVALPALSILTYNFPSFALENTKENYSNFLKLSEFLTCKKGLNATIGNRIFDNLNADNTKFIQQLSALSQTITQDKFTDMSQFSTFVDQHPELKPIAMDIISAWYLGYTGTPVMNATPAVGHSVDNARFVSYADALMYKPTNDATVIPSYARAHTNYWFYPPKTIAND